MAKLKLGVLGSGKGSNYRAIQEAIDAGTIDAEVVLVISDVESAGILELARRRGVPARFIAPGRFRTKLEPEIETVYLRELQKAGVELLILAGFMRMLKKPMLEAFSNRIINIHPSLLPAFPGIESWKQALEAGVHTTGCTVHYVDEGMDTGPIIAQSEVPVLPDDTPQTLHARIQLAERALYPAVLRDLTEGK